MQSPARLQTMGLSAKHAAMWTKGQGAHCTARQPAMASALPALQQTAAAASPARLCCCCDALCRDIAAASNAWRAQIYRRNFQASINTQQAQRQAARVQRRSSSGPARRGGCGFAFFLAKVAFFAAARFALPHALCPCWSGSTAGDSLLSRASATSLT